MTFQDPMIKYQIDTIMGIIKGDTFLPCFKTKTFT